MTSLNRVEPHAIIEDCDDYWRICFKPDVAGVIVEEPRPTNKATVSRQLPHLVEAWDAQQERQQDEARQVEQKFIAFVRRFNDTTVRLTTPDSRGSSIACDQRLLPGINRHWGELRECAIHSSEEGRFRVCNGCRINNQTQFVASEEYRVVATRGARVPVCPACASQVIQKHGVEQRGCVCDSTWSCYRCREAELSKLSKARTERYDAEGRCEQCVSTTNLVSNVDICLSCHGLRIYA